MKANLEESVKRLAQFLRRELTEEEAAGTAEEIVRLCSIEFLKELEVNKKGIYNVAPDFIFKNSTFSRKGKVKDRKEHLRPNIDPTNQQKLSDHGLIRDKETNGFDRDDVLCFS